MDNKNKDLLKNTLLSTDDLIAQKLNDAETTPAFGASMSPDEAEQAGIFIEDALTEKDALEATEGLNDGQ